MSDNSRTLSQVGALVGHAIDARRADPVAPSVDEAALAAHLDAYDFAEPRPLHGVVADLTDLLRRHAVRSDHPRYFGLFNPPALVSAIAGDLVASAINPQLAVWSHAPAAAEIERRLLRLFGTAVWPRTESAGVFTSGGSEANATALLAALSRRYPDWHREGLPRAGPRPAIYASAESHLAWIKIARACGLGSEAVRLAPTDDGLRLTGPALDRAIRAESGWTPVMVVATAGTTAHGAIDDIAGIAEVGRGHRAHVHVDAAWAGAALIHPQRAKLLDGVGHADSVTIDPHKWLSVPMGAGIYLARDWRALSEAFSVDASFMPSASHKRRDAYIHSIQWSRRFIGAKLFAAMATLGLDGYRALIDRSFALGDRLREALRKEDWLVLNDTPLPVVCFAPRDGDDECVRSIAAATLASGAGWIASVGFRDRLALRACITSFETTEADIDALVCAVGAARAV